jgi:hypothetical protein
VHNPFADSKPVEVAVNVEAANDLDEVPFV